MRPITILLSALIGPFLAAQNCVYTFGDDPAHPLSATTSDIFPQGPNVGAPFNQQVVRHHIRVPEYVFQNVPTTIHEMAFGVKLGIRTLHFTDLTIRMGHTTAPLGNNLFSQNITSPLTDVLVVHDHTWIEGNGPTWVPLGLQHSFQFLPGRGDLLIEILANGTNMTANNFTFTGCLAAPIGDWGVGGGPTLPNAITSGGPPPALRLCVDRAEVTLHGATCEGTPGSTPLLGVTGRPTLGSATTFWLSDAMPNGFAALVYGFNNAPPFPIDLTSQGAPGCRQYFNMAFNEFVLTNPSGIGAHVLQIPNSPAATGLVLYTQYFAFDPAGNALGITTSNYARLLLGQ
jgi:hypothetical protein